MLILVSLVPWVFAINPGVSTADIKTNVVYIETAINNTEIQWNISETNKKTFEKTKKHIAEIKHLLNAQTIQPLKLRLSVLELQSDFKNISKIGTEVIAQAQADNGTVALNSPGIDPSVTVNSPEFNLRTQKISQAIDYAPKWIIILISLSLGMWTMVGWKRIVVTIWEKIGKEKLNYAQATTSAMITAITISLASKLALPVSTTHVLSSSVAWSMTSGKHAGIQGDTVKSILMAWILTLPVTMLLSWILFVIFWYFLV